MHKRLYCLREIEKITNVVHTLRYTKHNGFPVVAASSPCTCSLLIAPDADCPVHLDIRRYVPHQVVGGSESLGFVPYGSTGSRPGSSLLPRPPSGYNLLSAYEPSSEYSSTPSLAPPPPPPTAESVDDGDLARPTTPSRPPSRRRSRSTGLMCGGCLQQAAEGCEDACPIHSSAMPTADDGGGVLSGLVLRSQLLLALKNGAFCDVRGRSLHESGLSRSMGSRALGMQLFLDSFPRAPHLEVRYALAIEAHTCTYSYMTLSTCAAPMSTVRV